MGQHQTLPTHGLRRNENKQERQRGQTRRGVEHKPARHPTRRVTRAGRAADKELYQRGAPNRDLKPENRSNETMQHRRESRLKLGVQLHTR